MSIEKYPELYKKLGVSHGGDGIKTFHLPNYTKITPELKIYICCKNTKLTIKIFEETILGEIKLEYIGYTPEDYISCNGQALSIKKNIKLYQLLNNNEDHTELNTTKFKIPNLTKKHLVKKYNNIEYETHYLISTQGRLVSEIEEEVNRSFMDNTILLTKLFFNKIRNNKLNSFLSIIMIFSIIYNSSIDDIFLRIVLLFIAFTIISRLIFQKETIESAIRFDHKGEETLINGLFKHAILSFKIILIITSIDLLYKLYQKDFQFNFIPSYLNGLTENMPSTLCMIIFFSLLYQCRVIGKKKFEEEIIYDKQKTYQSESFFKMCGLDQKRYNTYLNHCSSKIEKEEAFNIINNINDEIHNKIKNLSLDDEIDKITIPTFIYRKGLPGVNYFDEREFHSFSMIHIEDNQLKFYDYNNKFYDIQRNLIASIPISSVLEIEVIYKNKKTILFNIIQDSLINFFAYYIMQLIFIIGYSEKIIPIGSHLIIKYINYDGIVSEAIFDIPVDMYLFKKMPESFNRTRAMLMYYHHNRSKNNKSDLDGDPLSYESSIISTSILILTSMFKGDQKAYKMGLESKSLLEEFCYNLESHQ